jgi:hypothetical protein
MKFNTQNKTDTYNNPGDRLAHILDQIGFKQGRGRVIDFQNYLTRTSPKQFKDLKYTTVRAWFQDHAPPMHKIDVIIETLQTNYSFQHDVSHIKTWWKAGGFYPFSDNGSPNHPTILELMERAAIIKEKLPFIIMAIITEETGELFKSLTGSELVKISDKTTYFAESFLDPLNMECTDEYLRAIIRYELKKVMNSIPPEQLET